MSIQYIHANDELSYNPWISDGSDDGWWSGVTKCAATVALAATLAITAASTVQASQQITWGGSQDDPAGSLHTTVVDEDYCQRRFFLPYLRDFSQGADGQLIGSFDEDFWRNSVFPTPSAIFVQLPFIEKDDVPAGRLYGVPEEDFWQNPVSPVLSPSFIPQQLTFDIQEPAGSLALAVDDEPFQQPVPPDIFYPVRYWIGDEEVVIPSSSTFVFDEDYWQQTSVIPTQKVYGRGGGSGPGTIDDEPWQQPVTADFGFKVSLWIDDSSTIPQPLPIEEDFWQNSVLPVPLYPVPIVLRDDDVWVPPVVVIALPFDEEVWFNPVVPVPSYPVPISFRDDDIFVPFVPTVGLPFDEETWQQQTELGPNYPVTLWMDDSGTVPVPPLSPDDDFWQNNVSPVIAQNAIPQYWNFDTQEPAGSLYGLDDELFWTNPTPPIPWTFGKLYLPDTNDDAAGTFASPIDEVYWQNSVLPVQSINYIGLPLLPDAEEIPANTLHGQPDEDFWQNPVSPVIATLGRIYAPDFDEIPAAGLKGQPDEDYWTNPVPPVASYPVPFVYTDREEIPAGSLYMHPEDDYWQNPVFPIPATFGKMYAMDLDDIPAGAFHGQPDEDFWINSVGPVPFYPVPLVFSDDEIIVPQPPIAFDEDFWNNSVLPIVASNYVLLPYLPDPEEIPAGSLIPPAPPNPCPCSGIPNIPKDRVYDIVLCNQGFVNNVHVWLACIFAQPGSLLAQHMGSSIVTLYVYGPQAVAFAEARQFVNHNMGT